MKFFLSSKKSWQGYKCVRCFSVKQQKYIYTVYLGHGWSLTYSVLAVQVYVDKMRLDVC